MDIIGILQNSPLLSTLIYGGVLVWCGYHLGKTSDEQHVIKIVDWLIDEGYLRYREDEDGEIEILKLNERE